MAISKTQTKRCLGTVALAALIGGLAGAVVGVMFAPKLGKDLRQDIRRKVKNLNQCSEDIQETKKTGYITLNNPKAKVTRAAVPPT